MKKKIQEFFKNIIKFFEYLLLKTKPYQQYLYNREKKKLHQYEEEIKQDLVHAYTLLKQMNAKMIAAGWNRSRRKQFRRDFINNGLFGEEMFEGLVKDKANEDRKSEV